MHIVIILCEEQKNTIFQKLPVKMKINLTVSNEQHVQLVSSVLDNMMDSAFNDVTLVCSDGQLKVNGLTLALIIPEPYRSLQLGEGALLLLPQHTIKEILEVEQSGGQVQVQEEEFLLEREGRLLKEEDTVTDTEVKNIVEIKSESNQTEPNKDSNETFDVMEGSSDEESDQENENTKRSSWMSSMKYITREKHVPQVELAEMRARYISGQTSIWLIVDEKFIFHRNGPIQGTTRSMVSWNCSGKRRFGCMARALTHRLSREGTSQIEAGCPVRLVWVWKSKHHTCNVDYSPIFIRDLKNRIKHCWLADQTLKYKTAFEDSKGFLISRIPSKDLRKKLRKECKMETYKTWFYKSIKMVGVDC